MDQQYMTNAQGHHVPVDLVKDIDKLRNQTVLSIWERFKTKAGELEQFRSAIAEEINSFLSLSAEQYRVKLGGAKGGVSLTSYDGNIKITIGTNDIVNFTEQIKTAQTLIYECIELWTEGTKPEVRAIIDNAFKVGKSGMMSVSRVTGLFALDIEDEKWKTAMQAVRDSMQVVSSRKYLRFYVRGADGKYQLQPLDATAL